MANFANVLSIIDTHTAGEPTRIVLCGLPIIPGSTMMEKKYYMAENMDHFRTMLMHEPRGHNDMFGAVLLPPISPQAQYGVLFIEQVGYLDMCGHGTIGLTTALIESGMVQAEEPETVVVFDTPAGLVKGHALVNGGRVVEVTVTNVPSFLYTRDVSVDIPGMGRISMDISFGGNFFALVQANELGVSVHLENVGRLIELGLVIKKAVNQHVHVQHPTDKRIKGVELVEIFEPYPDMAGVKNVVIIGDGQVDRSPCGTGTSASMAARHAKGELSIGKEFISESILGTQFKGKLLKETRIGKIPGVISQITGSAYIVGFQQFVVDPNDPLKHGFRMNRVGHMTC
jgi:proline racemase/trans-L-3-hydroxyproline dehydratase